MPSWLTAEATCPLLAHPCLQELPAEVAQVPSPRVLDASLNRLERLPPSLPTSLQRLVLSSNRLSSLDGLEQLRNLKVRTFGEGRLLRLGCDVLAAPCRRRMRWSEQLTAAYQRRACRQDIGAAA